MIHLGDITKINGHTAPIVDCIIGGSPCQDLSVAGKRAGLDGERSGLYMEQIRIVKEMRAEDERNGRTGVDIRPRYMVWENVPGAFSSNKGEDFRIVLEELAKVKDKDAVVPLPNEGKWTSCGCIMGDGWSIAWRVLDAQFWGVPQRRRRIALIADFGGHSAPEILFIRKSVSRDIDEGESKRKEAPSDATGGIGADNRLGADQYNAVILGDTVSTLGVNCGMSHGRQCILEPHPLTYDARGNGDGQTVNTITGDHNNRITDYTSIVLALDREAYNSGQNFARTPGIYDDDIAPTMISRGPGAVCYSIDQGGGKSSVDVRENTSPTLTTTHDGAPAVAYIDTSHADDVVRIDDVVAPLQARDYKGGKLIAAVDCRNGTEDKVNGALQSNSAHSLNGNNVVRTRYIVRRLTPLECERLQGYPDGWTDIGEWVDTNGKKRQTSDAARYKALGNSIALPPWKWVLKRLCACYERDATMASLFDGISGFPLLWTQLNGWGSVLWTSEIEEFPIAVCKRHFGDEATGEKGDFYEAILGRNKTEDV